MRAAKVITKLVVLSVIIVIRNIFVQTVSPLIANDLAMKQMSNEYYSSGWIMMYSYISGSAWIIVCAVLSILLFRKDVLNLIRYFKEKYNEEV